MKKHLALLLAVCLLFLSACKGENPGSTSGESISSETAAVQTVPATEPVLEGTVTWITLKGDTVLVDGTEAGTQESAVYVSRDIIYYEDKDSYESGNPYGDGEAHERHSAGEAEAHLVVNITKPGNYRVSGELALGQIRIDLGETAKEDPTAVVNLVLDGAKITATAAPAILFLNVYECDGGWSVDTASPDVDTAGAGANLILAAGSENVVSGSHVAKIYKDKDGEKKLWKQDGAIYSYMSMNVAGSGSLELHADNEGLDTELHLTINGGDIAIYSNNDGINTNEDGVSVTTINGGNLRIAAGLGDEGDGIDSNGYLVINGGSVVATANPASDAGLDSDLGSFINGGTVVALGSAMDWAESDSDQVTMNLQYDQMQSGDSAILVTREDGRCVFAYDPGEDEALREHLRSYCGAVISCPDFQVGDGYHIIMGSVITGRETGGIYDAAAVTGINSGVLQGYTGTDVMMSPGGPRPEGGMVGQNPPDLPDNGVTPPGGFTPPEGDYTIPERPGDMPQMPAGGRPGGFGGGGPGKTEELHILFYMQDKVNFFSGLTGSDTN